MKQHFLIQSKSRGSFVKSILMVLGFIVVCGFSPAAEAVTTIKFATLAPEGTSWMKAMRKLDQVLREKTGGEVKFRFYAGGVMGDEKDVLRKMKFGQIHAGGFTGLGLGQIASEMRVLEIPGSIRNYEEADAVLKKVGPDLAAALDKKGYTLLGWAEVGFAYLFTNKKVSDISDLSGVKMWMWEGDPLAKATFKGLKISPVPMALPDVLTSLQTGLVDAIYGSPLAVTALQWHSKVKYMINARMAYVSGAVVVKNKILDKLSPAHRKILLDESRAAMADITASSRVENEQAIEAMKKTGVIVLPSNARDLEILSKAGMVVRDALSGKLFPRSLADKVSAAVKQVRAAQSN